MMPIGLTGTYERIWNRITSGTSHPTQRKWALKTLKLILFAKRPLSPQEILEATSLDPMDTTFAVGRMVSSIDYLIDACGNFVALDFYTSRVRFVHYSVQEFLGSKLEFHSSESMITEACFITLGQEHGGRRSVLRLCYSILGRALAMFGCHRPPARKSHPTVPP